MGLLSKQMNFMAFVRIGQELYFSCRIINGLFQLNLRTGIVHFLASFPGEKLMQTDIHAKGILFENLLVFLPNKGNYIHIFDRKLNTFIITIPFKYSVFCALLWRNGILMLPSMENSELKYLSMQDFSIRVIPGFMESIYNCKDKNAFKGVTSAVCDGDSILYTLARRSQIYKFSLTEKKRRTFELDCFEKQDTPILFRACEKDWILDLDNGNVYSTLSELLDFKECESNIFLKAEKRLYTGGFEYNDVVYLLPGRAEFFLKFDKSREVFVKAFDYPKEFRIISGDIDKFWPYEIIDEKLYIYPYNSNGILIVNSLTDSVQILLMPTIWQALDEENRKHFFQKLIEEETFEGQKCENEWYDLRDFIEMVKYMKIEEKDCNNIRYGYKIYEKLGKRV